MTRSPILTLGFVLALCSACSHGSQPSTLPTVEPPVPELPLVSLVDPATPGAVHVDLGRIHDSNLVRTASGWIDLVRANRPPTSDMRFVVEILDCREALMFVAVREGEPLGVLLLRGSFDDADLERFADESTGTGETYTHGPFTVHRLGTDGAIARLGGHTLVLGTTASVDAVLDRQLAGGTGHYPEGEAFQALATRVGFTTNPIGFVVVPTPEMRAATSGSSDSFLAALSAAKGLAIALDPGEGLRGRVAVDLDTSLEAMGLATIARMQLGRVAEDPSVQQTGLGALLPYLQISRDGTTVTGTLDAPRGVFDDSIRTLDGFVRETIESP